MQCVSGMRVSTQANAVDVLASTHDACLGPHLLCWGIYHIRLSYIKCRTHALSVHRRSGRRGGCPQPRARKHLLRARGRRRSARAGVMHDFSPTPSHSISIPLHISSRVTHCVAAPACPYNFSRVEKCGDTGSIA